MKLNYYKHREHAIIQFLLFLAVVIYNFKTQYHTGRPKPVLENVKHSIHYLSISNSLYIIIQNSSNTRYAKYDISYGNSVNAVK